jgi:hypothetical protein
MAPKRTRLIDLLWDRAFLASVPEARPDLGPCIERTGWHTPSGYQTIWDASQQRQVRAHKVAYTLHVGPVPKGLILDHLCVNPKCVNPFHLEPVTWGENVLRGNSPFAINARKTHCPKDHPLSGDNLYIDPRGKRECRECRRESGRRQMAKAKAVA